MEIQQLDLFDDVEPQRAPVLNGVYYERSTDKFVSYVLSERYYEFPAKGCEFLREWQERIKKERAI